MSGRVLLAALLIFAAGGADAADKKAPKPPPIVGATLAYTYYNKPGATLDEHNNAVRECLKAVARIRPTPVPPYVGGLVGAWSDARAMRGFQAGALENCMVVRGWRVVKIPSSEGSPMSEAGPAETARQLAPWVGAEQPNGEIIKTWTNGAVSASTERFFPGSLYFERGLLSYYATTGETTFRPPLSRDPSWPEATIPAIWTPKKPLSLETLDSAPPGSAILIVRMKGKIFGTTGFAFSRLGPVHGRPPSVDDQLPDTIVLEGLGVGAKIRSGIFLVVAIPPGRWRMKELGTGVAKLDLCLGSPMFDVAAGEVVYLGDFELQTEDLTPDLNMETVRAFLAGRPSADIVRPAAYTNGSTAPCQGQTIYALEFTGFPTEPGYREKPIRDLASPLL